MGCDVGFDPFRGIGDAFSGIGHVFEDIGRTVGKSFEAILKNPLPTIETLALTAAGVPYPIAAAAVSAANGGNIQQIAISAAVAYASAGVGEYLGGQIGTASEFGTTPFTQQTTQLLAQSSGVANPSLIAQIVAGSSGSALAAAATGKNFDQILMAGVSGAITGAVNNQLLSVKDANGNPIFKSGDISTNLLTNATNAATRAIMSGKSVTEAITQASVVTLGQFGTISAYNGLKNQYQDFKNQFDALQTNYNKAQSDYKNFESGGSSYANNPDYKANTNEDGIITSYSKLGPEKMVPEGSDSDGNPIPEHMARTPDLDANGNPITITQDTLIAQAKDLAAQASTVANNAAPVINQMTDLSSQFDKYAAQQKEIDDRYAITTAYTEKVGRPPDQAGLDYWMQKVSTGTPITDVVNAIGGSQEATNAVYTKSTGTTDYAEGTLLNSSGQKVQDLSQATDVVLGNGKSVSIKDYLDSVNRNVPLNVDGTVQVKSPKATVTVEFWQDPNQTVTPTQPATVDTKTNPITQTDQTAAVSEADVLANSGQTSSQIADYLKKFFNLDDATSLVIADKAVKNISDKTSVNNTNVTGANLTGVTGANLTGVTGSNLTGVTGANLTGVTGANLTGVTGANLTGVTGDNLTGVTGDNLTGVTGDVTGNVTGDVTGNVTGGPTGNFVIPKVPITPVKPITTPTSPKVTGATGPVGPGMPGAPGTANVDAFLTPIFGGGGTKIAMADPLAAFQNKIPEANVIQAPTQPTDVLSTTNDPYTNAGFLSPIFRAGGGAIPSPMASTGIKSPMTSQEATTMAALFGGNADGKYTPIKMKNPLDYFKAAEGGEVPGHNPEFYSEGGLQNRYVKGEGDGTSDSVPAMLASGEFVIPADVVSSLGNGDNDAGASVLDEFLKTIREHKRRADARHLPPDSKGALSYLQQAQKKVKV